MKICVISGGIGPALNGTILGGAEKQSALIAAGLAARGHDVTAIDPSHEEAGARVRNVRLIGLGGLRGLPVAGLVTRRLPRLVEAVSDTAPDVVYIRSVDPLFAGLAMRIRRVGCALVWGVAHDQELDPSHTRARVKGRSLYGRIVHGAVFNAAARTLEARADLILAQTRSQEELLKKRGRAVAFMPNLFEMRDAPAETTRQAECVWIAKFCGTKGERELLELARRLPGRRIRAIGQAAPEFMRQALWRELRQQENIDMTGRLEYSDAMRELGRSSLLVHTAPAEGFSNTFLEAWACCVPVVSLNVDPDGLLNSGLGFCARGNIDAMAQRAMELLDDAGACRAIGKRGRAYVLATHDCAVVSEKIERAFGKIAGVAR